MTLVASLCALVSASLSCQDGESLTEGVSPRAEQVLLDAAISAGDAADAATAAPSGWHELVSHAWSLAPGKENLGGCGAVTLERDTYLRGIRAVDAPGTHHWMLAVLQPGQDECDGSVIQGTGLFFVSGVSSPPFSLPEGVAFHIPAGTRVGYQIHMLNTGDEPIVDAVSRVDILETTREGVRDLAEMFMPGAFPFLPPMMRSTTRGVCTIRSPQTLFALFPHMHRLGVHFRSTLVSAGRERVLFDGAWDHREQPYVPLDPPLRVAPGDRVVTECTYVNTTTREVGPGESTAEEMCFSFLYRFPKLEDPNFCLF